MAHSSATLVSVRLLASTSRSLCSRGSSRSETCAKYVRRLTNRCVAFGLAMGFATPSTAWRYPQNAPPAGNHVIGQSFRDCQTYCPGMVILAPGNSQSADHDGIDRRGRANSSNPNPSFARGLFQPPL
jgi:hypothetical protein